MICRGGKSDRQIKVFEAKENFWSREKSSRGKSKPERWREGDTNQDSNFIGIVWEEKEKEKFRLPRSIFQSRSKYLNFDDKNKKSCGSLRAADS